MLGKRSAAADHPYLDYVGRDSFYGLLATQRAQLFRDEDFAALYCLNNGRPSVPPSLLATALLLQVYDGVSDEEAKARADFDLRWKVALGVGLEERPFAKSTLQLFRAQLILHDQVRTVFQHSLAFARHAGYFRKQQITAVLDTSFIFGRGAVKDTYNLLADGIVTLVRALARHAGSAPETWAAEHDLTRYFGSSLKGAAAIDWDDPGARDEFLTSVVADADRLLDCARHSLAELAADHPDHTHVREAANLLAHLLVQDVERHPDGVRLKQGVSADRIVSVHDPEMRHGRKSATKRFDGHKGAIAVDPESQLITAVVVLPGNAQDGDQALDLVEQTEANTMGVVAETVGDCAFGTSDTRQVFAEAGRKLVAKVPTRRGQAQFPKEDFQLDLAAMRCICPAGQESTTVVSISSGKRYGAPDAPLRAFRFDAARCDACPLRPACVRARSGRGRLVMIHPQEALLQDARAFQHSPGFTPYRTLRQVAEHRLARLMQLGVRQARYVGRTKTLCQLLLAATVANLTLVATKVGLMPDRPRSRINAAYPFLALVLLMIPMDCAVGTLQAGWKASDGSSSGGFRPHF